MKSLALLVVLAVATVHARKEAVRMVSDIHAVPDTHVEPEVVDRLPMDANLMRYRDAQRYDFLKGLGNVAGNVIKGWGDSLQGTPTSSPTPQFTPAPASPTASIPQGRMSRLSGAAARISVDDSQCVMCQYLVQRVQSEMSRFTTFQAAGAGDVTLLEVDATVTQKDAPMDDAEDAERFSEDADSIMPPNVNPSAGENVATPKQLRIEDQLSIRPPFTRVDSSVSPSPDPQREQERFIYEQMVQTVYDRLAGMCGTRVPEQYLSYCNNILQNFRNVAQGLRYGDRPDQVCMRYDYCDAQSYIRSSPHNIYTPQ